MSSPLPSLSWPSPESPLPIAPLRPVLDRLTSLAVTHPRDVALIPGLATEEGEVVADPPPALEQIVDEFGGLRVRGQDELTLVIDERVDVGPYTLLGEATTFYPLHEGSDAAVILALGEDGTPGAVYGIGEDLALRLAGRDLGEYLGRFADALERTLAELDEHILREHDEASLESDDVRAEAIEELLDQHLYGEVLGLREDAEALEVPVLAADRIQGVELPEGTVGAADVRTAPLGAAVPVIDAELPGDPLEWSVAWREGGLVVCVLAS